MAEKQSSSFKQSLGLIDATMIVAGSMIGSGIFIVSAAMAEDRSGLIGRKSGVHSGRDSHMGFIQGTGRVDPHARYSNDVAYEFGTVSKLGDKQIAKTNYQRLIALAEGSNSNRKEIELGKAYLKAN